jgi:hypothetical protein
MTEKKKDVQEGIRFGSQIRLFYSTQIRYNNRLLFIMYQLKFLYCLPGPVGGSLHVDVTSVKAAASRWR